MPVVFRCLHEIEIKNREDKIAELSKFNDKLIKENAEYRKYINRLEKCCEYWENKNCELHIKNIVLKSQLDEK